MTADDSGQHDAVSLAEHREQLALLSRTLEREAHILQREPEVLPSHLHNMLYLDEGEESPAAPLLARAREALAERPWLRLTNRPPVGRSALVRVMEHGERVRCVAWSPDGALFASGGDDNRVRRWDPATGRLIVVLEGHTDKVRALAWSPGGPFLASSSTDKTVRLWHPAPRRLRAILEGHTSSVHALAWSPDGALLASGGGIMDDTVRLWYPTTGDCRLVAHCLSPIKKLEFGDGGRILRAADNGAATGNRPIAYLFELCNMEIPPPAGQPKLMQPPRPAAKLAPRRTKRAPRSKKQTAKRPVSKKEAEPEARASTLRPAPQPRRRPWWAFWRRG